MFTLAGSVAFSGTVARRGVARAPVLIALLILPALFAGCRSFNLAQGTPDQPQVAKAAEEVLKERYYQVKVDASLAHVFAISEPAADGTYKARTKVDVHILPERTGHYVPKVYVRVYYDDAEPPLESGDFAGQYEDVRGHPFAIENWKPIYYDRRLEEEIRKAILAKLNVQIPA